MKMQKRKQKNEIAAAAEAKCENTEADAEEVERVCTGNMMNDSVEMAGEAVDIQDFKQ